VAGSPTQRNRHSPPRELPAQLNQEQHALDVLLLQEPIPHPKPWTDEFERAAIAGCAYATPPQVSLRSLGIPSSVASAWLSDSPPETYRSACVALAERLNKATAWCEKSLLARIAAAGAEPSRWQANAWILERSKSFSHQYIAVSDQTLNGPATVINIGQLTVNQGAPGRVTWRDDDIVEALPSPPVSETP